VPVANPGDLGGDRRKGDGFIVVGEGVIGGLGQTQWTGIASGERAQPTGP